VRVGDTLQTGPGEGISLRLANNESLRLGPNTRLIVDDNEHLQLQGGRIYADSGEYIYRDGALTIETGFGVVRDIGTQFAVVQEDGRLEVAVREGRVDVTAMADTYVAVAGERMSIEAGTEPVLQPIAPSDAYWDWTTKLAPSYDIEDKSLHDFLRWAARETGSELVFSDEGLRLAAMREDLHGSIADFSPEDAIASVLPTTSFNYRLEDGRILIER
jgi:ferric-dicitrate binding protein FerR (iron transport regulator)